MAERLKDHFGPDVPRRIADMLVAVEPTFPAERFVAESLDGYDELELLDRARAIAGALGNALPADYADAADLLVRSLGPPLERTEGNGMAPFLYMPHVFYVAEHGLADFEVSMAAQHALTQRFTCEFSIRPFIVSEPERTLAVLAAWTRDDSVHVRRLVSEGTRPRLPWAPRLDAFVADPSPILPLLDALKDDPEEYVRRSVANNLNDISKDNPAVAIDTAGRWLDPGAGEDRRRLVRHALRTLSKAGDEAALGVLGFRADSPVVPSQISVDPAAPRIGGQIHVEVELTNPADELEPTIAELRVWFMKSSGDLSPRTFRLGEVDLPGGEAVVLKKRVSLKQHTTRTHYPGTHRIEVMVNGTAHAGPEFELAAA